MTPKYDLAHKLEGKEILRHPQMMFIYHATQRMNSIRYYMTILAALVGAFTAIQTFDIEMDRDRFNALVCGGLLGVTLVFWALDYRNAQLVRINEDALDEIERKVRADYGLQNFEMIARARQSPGMLKYRNVVPVMFLSVTALSALGLWNALQG